MQCLTSDSLIHSKTLLPLIGLLSSGSPSSVLPGNSLCLEQQPPSPTSSHDWLLLVIYMFGCHLLREAFLDYPTKTVTLYHKAAYVGGWEQTQTGFTWANSLHFPMFCKFPLSWLYWAPLIPTLSPHSPCKMPSHLCKHPNKSDLSSVHARPFLCYWLKSVLTTFNQCPDLFISDTRHQAKTSPLQPLIWFSWETYEMTSLFTDRDTEGQGSHLLKTTEQVCSIVPPTAYFLPCCREERNHLNQKTTF